MSPSPTVTIQTSRSITSHAPKNGAGKNRSNLGLIARVFNMQVRTQLPPIVGGQNLLLTWGRAWGSKVGRNQHWGQVKIWSAPERGHVVSMIMNPTKIGIVFFNQSLRCLSSLLNVFGVADVQVVFTRSNQNIAAITSKRFCRSVTELTDWSPPASGDRTSLNCLQQNPTAWFCIAA